MNLMYFQSGGPTSVINSSLFGVIDSFQNSNKIDKLYASKFGLSGLINNDYFEIKKNKNYKSIIKNSGAILGSARIKLSEDFNDKIYDAILKNTLNLDLDYLLFNGGNDSMETATKLNNFFKVKNIKTRVIGIPKTIDNDLYGVDHCPGYASAAKYIVETIEDITLDLDSYKKGRVTIVEVMGREAGWLALSSSLAKKDLGPDLIYIPEITFDIDEFLKDIKRVYSKKNRVLVVVSEALKDKEGKHICASKAQNDGFDHFQLGSVSKILCDIIEEKLHYPTRGIEFNLMQRCSTSHISKVDQKEAYELGKEAVKLALNNESGFMVGLIKENNEYKIGKIPCEKAQNYIRYVPRNYMNKAGNFVSKEGKEYLNFIKKDIKHKKQLRKIFED